MKTKLTTCSKVFIAAASGLPTHTAHAVLLNMKSRICVLILAAAAVMGALLPAIASATPILPAPLYVSALTWMEIGSGWRQQEFRAPGTYTLEGVSTTVHGLPSPLVTGHVLAGTDQFGSFGSSIRYSFTVDGPLYGVQIPLFVAVTLNASATGQYSNYYEHTGASARFGLWASGFQLLGVGGQTDNNNPSVGFSGTLPFNARSGEIGSVNLQINVMADGLFGRGWGVADAFVDPFIFIDPAFLLSNPGYSVIVSPGIGNTAVAAAPEPATLILFGTVLFPLVMLNRRRKT